MVIQRLARDAVLTKLVKTTTPVVATTADVVVVLIAWAVFEITFSFLITQSPEASSYPDFQTSHADPLVLIHFSHYRNIICFFPLNIQVLNNFTMKLDKNTDF